MKKIESKSGLIVLIMMLLFPLQTVAAGRDAVMLIQEEDKVEVLLEMSNADKERITAVSVSLRVNVDEGSRDRVLVSFDFASGLSGAEKDFLYDKSTGILNIYAASSRSLFGEDALKLGYVKVIPEDQTQILSVEISYQEGSFRTANGSYGSKIPMVARISDPVDMQVGQGVVYDVITSRLEEYLEWTTECRQENYTEENWEGLQQTISEARGLLAREDITQKDVNEMAQKLYQMMRRTLTGGFAGDGTGSAQEGSSGTSGTGLASGGQSGQGSGESQQSSGGSNSGNSDNINQGLYDDSTVFVHDPASAQNISSAVVREEKSQAGLMDLSQGLAAQMGGKPSGQGSGSSPVKARVSVVAPGDGPASIHVASAGGNADSGENGESPDGAGAGQSLSEQESAAEEEGLQDEILLDQKNGGVQGERKKINMSLLLWSIVAVAAAGGLGLSIFLIAGRERAGAPAKKGRKKKKSVKRKKPVGKKKKKTKR